MENYHTSISELATEQVLLLAIVDNSKPPFQPDFRPVLRQANSPDF